MKVYTYLFISKKKKFEKKNFKKKKITKKKK